MKKLCIECKWSKPTVGRFYATWACIKLSETRMSLVTGTIELIEPVMCEDARSDLHPSLCGVEARFWEGKTNQYGVGKGNH